MSGKNFDRTIINQRERPLSTDINQAQTQIERTIREYVDRLFLGRTSTTNPLSSSPVSGFIGDSLRVLPNSPIGLSVLVTTGIGFQLNASDVVTAIGSIPGVDDQARYKPVILNTQQTLTVPAAPTAPNSRIDIVEVKYNRHTADTSTRDVLNVGTGAFDPTSVQKTLAWAVEDSVTLNGSGALNYKTGTAAVSPSVPATDSGYIKIAEILVGTSVTTIDADVIKDTRQQLFVDQIGNIGFEVSQPTSVSLKPTLSNVHAPPGFVVVALGVSFTNAQCTVFAWGGDLTSAILPNITASYKPAVISSPSATVVNCISDYFTIDGSTQTALAGANASTATKVAVGQVALRVQLSATSATNPTVYGAQLMTRGG